MMSYLLCWASFTNYVLVFFSDEAKPVVQDKISEVALGLISAYDSGELTQALAEGRDGWQKWVKGFGKSLKRKVCCDSIMSSFSSVVLLTTTGSATSSVSDLSHLNNDAKNHEIAGESFDANLGRKS